MPHGGIEPPTSCLQDRRNTTMLERRMRARRSDPSVSPEEVFGATKRTFFVRVK